MTKPLFTHPTEIYQAWLHRYYNEPDLPATAEQNVEIPLIIQCSHDSTTEDINRTLDSIKNLRHKVNCTIVSPKPIINPKTTPDKLNPRVSIQQIQSGIYKSTIKTLVKNTSNPWLLLAAAGITISKHTLTHLQDGFQKNNKACIIYGDEDFIDHDNERMLPHFKPDFNYRLFLEQSIASEMLAIKTENLLDMATADELECSSPANTIFGLTLRVFESYGKESIVHIPKILSHRWLRGEGSGNLLPSEAELIERRFIISEHLKRRDQDAKLENGIIPSFTRIRHPVPKEQPLVSIVIPTRDKADLLRQCISSIFLLSTYPNFEILVVDNQSVEDATHSLYKEYAGKINLIDAPFPFNFSKLVNLGVQASKGEYIILLNNDIEILSPDWIEELLSHAAQSGVGAVGAKLLYPDGKSQHSGVITGIGGVAGHSHKGFHGDDYGYFGRAQSVQEYSAVTGACIAVSRINWNNVNGFDEKLTVAFNDVDFCLRLRESGLINVWTPYVTLIHHESASRGYEDTPEKHARFIREWSFMRVRWDEILDQDPAYNPNLTSVFQDFSLSWPPREKEWR